MVEELDEDGGVAPERIDHREDADEAEESQVAREQPAPGDALPEQQRRRDGAGEDVVHGAVRVGALGDRVPHRAPIIVGVVQRAEDVGRQQRDEARRRQGVHRRDAVADGGPVEVGQQLHGEQRRNGQHGDDHHGREGEQGRPAGGETQRALRREALVDDGGRDGEAAQERDLVAPQRHQPGADREGERGAPGFPRQGDLHEEERRQEERIGEDHAGMLQAGRGGPPEHDHHGRRDRPDGVPAAPPEQAQRGEGGQQQMGEDDPVEELHRRFRRSQAKSAMVGVNSSDCGSATEGWPLKWKGFQSGHSPCASAAPR